MEGEQPDTGDLRSLWLSTTYPNSKRQDLDFFGQLRMQMTGVRMQTQTQMLLKSCHSWTNQPPLSCVNNPPQKQGFIKALRETNVYARHCVHGRLDFDEQILGGTMVSKPPGVIPLNCLNGLSMGGD